jgi:hypothetical protein
MVAQLMEERKKEKRERGEKEGERGEEKKTSLK